MYIPARCTRGNRKRPFIVLGTTQIRIWQTSSWSFRWQQSRMVLLRKTAYARVGFPELEPAAVSFLGRLRRYEPHVDMATATDLTMWSFTSVQSGLLVSVVTCVPRVLSYPLTGPCTDHICPLPVTFEH